MKKLALILISLCLAVLPVFAQRQVQGTVIDSRDNAPVSGARVSAGGEIATTDADGFFTLGNLPEKGKVTLSISALGYKPETFNVSDFSGGQYKLVETVGISSTDVSGVELDDDEDMGYSGQTVAGIQNQSYDVFDRNSGYNLGTFYFRARGLDNQYNNVYINGALMNDAENGRATWSEWGGLNNVTRAKESVTGLGNSNFGFGNLGGEQNINMKASAIGRGHRVTYSIGNANYTNRLMYTYSSGITPKGWAFAASISGRLGYGNIVQNGIRVPCFNQSYANKLLDKGGIYDGTQYSALGYYASVEKRFLGTGHTLSFIAFGAPIQRSTAGGSYQEVYNLVGSNYYNGNWGYQNDEFRSARVRTTILPTFLLVWDYEKENTTVNTTASYQFGRASYTSLNWYDAPDPRPDYYRYLPSYYTDPGMKDYITQLWQTDPSKSQLNWDALYQANYTQNQLGAQAKYVIEDRRNDVNDFNLGTNVNHQFNQNVKLTGGARIRNNITHNYKIISDLLGGDYWVDIDQYGERDFSTSSNQAQNDLDNPNKIIRAKDVEKGRDKFLHTDPNDPLIYGYNYDMHLVYAQLYATAVLEYAHWDFYGGVNLSNSNFWRYGYMRNGRADAQGYANGSKGKGETHSFFDYGIKTGATWKINGRNYLYANVRWQTNAPYIRNAYISPRVKDAVTSDLKSEKNFSVDVNYVLKTPVVNARFTLYHTMIFDAMESFGFYHDDYRTFVNYTLSDMNMVMQGVEFGIEVKIIPSLTATLIGNYGNYRYTNNPNGTVSAENGTFADQTNTVYYENFHVTGTPQTAASFGLNYQAPYNIYISANVNYAGRNYLSMNPERRTTAAVIGVPAENPELLHKIVDQERMEGGVTLDISVGKTFRLKGCQLSLNASVNNVTNNNLIKTGGYEQRRFDYYGLDVDKYPSRYFYAYGLGFMINASVRF